MPHPLVSIILPTYNRSRYVAGAIDSVLNQTCSDWELVVVDDGSTDDTPQIVWRYEALYPGRIRRIGQRNLGVAPARNRGIRESRGTYVAFIDSDDLWHPTKLALQIDAIKHLSSGAFIYTGYEIIDSSGHTKTTVRPDRRFRGDVWQLLWVEENDILGPTLLVPKDKLFAVGLFDETLQGPENLDLRLKLAKLGPVGFVDRILYSYRRHGDSLTANGEAMIEATQKMIRSHFSGHPSAEERQLVSRALGTCAYREGNLYFERMQYGKAIRSYARSWRGSSRKGELVARTIRCCLGRHGNAILRNLKSNWIERTEGART